MSKLNSIMQFCLTNIALLDFPSEHIGALLRTAISAASTVNVGG